MIILLYNFKGVKKKYFTGMYCEVSVLAKNLEISYLLDFYGDMLTEKQRNATELYYNDDLSLAEIAETADISRQGVRDTIKRAEQTLFEFEKKLGLAKRFSDMKQELSEIISAAKMIDKYSGEIPKVKEINKYTEIIIKTAEKLSAE